MQFGRLIRWQQVRAAKSRGKRAVQVRENKKGRHPQTAAGVLATHAPEDNAHALGRGRWDSFETRNSQFAQQNANKSRRLDLLLPWLFTIPRAIRLASAGLVPVMKKVEIKGSFWHVNWKRLPQESSF